MPRLFDESGAATPFSAQPQLSVDEAPWLTKASPEMPWKRPRSVADRPIVSAEVRPQSGAGEYLFEGDGSKRSLLYLTMRSNNP